MKDSDKLGIATIAGLGALMAGCGSAHWAAPAERGMSPTTVEARKGGPGVSAPATAGERPGSDPVGVAGVTWVYSGPAELWFTKSEVTLRQFKACVSSGACKERNRRTKSDSGYCNWGYEDRDEHPMNCVDWYGARDFCAWAGGRLPTAGEWFTEASDREQREYPWGHAPEANCDYVVMAGNTSDGCDRNHTWPVCSRPRGNSVSGLCDMSGNVWEWTRSEFFMGNDVMVLRGGSLRDELGYQRTSGATSAAAGAKGYTGGFRCVRPAPPVASETPPPVADSKQPVTLVWMESEPAGVWFTKTEVTVGQFKKCVFAGVCKEEHRQTRFDQAACNWGYGDREDHPMNCVDFQGAQEFCHWVDGRLPTLHEWYAEASNGGKWKYPWGNSPGADCGHAVMGARNDIEGRVFSDRYSGCGTKHTFPVCSRVKGNSVSDLCDMSGNVEEWISAKDESEQEVTGLAGGSFVFGNPEFLSTSSFQRVGSYTFQHAGFRCVGLASP